MDKGVIRQIENFRRDYRDGEAIVRKYLRLLNSPTYLTASDQKKLETIARKTCNHSYFSKYEEAIKVFPDCRHMTKPCISNKMKGLGYSWDKIAKQWRQMTQFPE